MAVNTIKRNKGNVFLKKLLIVGSCDEVGPPAGGPTSLNLSFHYLESNLFVCHPATPKAPAAIIANRIAEALMPSLSSSGPKPVSGNPGVVSVLVTPNNIVFDNEPSGFLTFTAWAVTWLVRSAAGITAVS